MKEFLKAHSKSISAAVAAAVVAQLAKWGFDVDVNALGTVIAALLVGATTYVAPKNEAKP